MKSLKIYRIALKKYIAYILYKCKFTQALCHRLSIKIKICPVLTYSNSLIILDNSAKISYIIPRFLVYKSYINRRTYFVFNTFFKMRFLEYFLMASLRYGLLSASETVYEPCDFLGKSLTVRPFINKLC